MYGPGYVQIETQLWPFKHVKEYKSCFRIHYTPLNLTKGHVSRAVLQ